MASDLSPAEKEDREAERLLNKKRPHSRKYKEKRAPRRDLRRNRMKVDDPDLLPRTEEHKDLSMRSRSANLLISTLHIALLPYIDDKLLKQYENDIRDLLHDPELDEDTIDRLLDRVIENAPDDADLDDYIDVLDEELLDNEDPNKPGPLLQKLMKQLSIATSNKIFGIMTSKTGTYHGVISQKGNPTDPPNTEYKSYDKRYFTDKNYDRILKYASGLLKEDWLKYGWDDNSDAKFRAALDMAVHMADGNLYQSKIDSETYMMLLNHLAKWGHDSFSQTILSEKIPRNAFDMTISNEYRNIIHIANELRTTSPVQALDILKNLRSLASTGFLPSMASTHRVTTESDSDKVEIKSIDDQDLNALKKDVKTDMDKLSKESDAGKFAEGVTEMVEDMQKKTSAVASISIPLVDLLRLANSDPEAKRILGPVIVAAAKKKKTPPKPKSKAKTDMKKEKAEEAKKESPKKDDKNPFPKNLKGKKRKATITQDDFNW
jgi:hypothetical protein